MITARSVSYRNTGEQVTLGISLIDENGDAVTITGAVKLIYRDPAGDRYEETGESSSSNAFYQGASGVDFVDVGKYVWWIETMGNRYGPYELEILDV